MDSFKKMVPTVSPFIGQFIQFMRDNFIVNCNYKVNFIELLFM